MKKLFQISTLFLFAFGSLMFTSCDNDDDGTEQSTFNLDINGLEDLGSDYVYEGWLIVNGSAISSGVFTVDGNGNLSQTSFLIDEKDLADASTFVLTIEPSPDNDPSPSDVHVLAGDFSGNSAALTVGHQAALGNDFSASTGTYILATPTDGMNNNEKSGVWFLDPTAGPGPGLDLPTLPAGWTYEGWAVINGTPVTTGTFTSVSGVDTAAPFSGMMSGPSYPGEDFVMNAPAGLTFPTDLSGGAVVISIEPVPDNSPAPFTLKPLLGNVANDALDHTPYSMNNISMDTNPTGSASR